MKSSFFNFAVLRSDFNSNLIMSPCCENCGRTVAMVCNEEVSESQWCKWIFPLISLFAVEICHSEHPCDIAIEEQALRDWRTEYDKVLLGGCQAFDSCSQWDILRCGEFQSQGVQPAEIRWLEV